MNTWAINFIYQKNYLMLCVKTKIIFYQNQNFEMVYLIYFWAILIKLLILFLICMILIKMEKFINQMLN